MRAAWTVVGLVVAGALASLAGAGPVPQASVHVHMQGVAFDPADVDATIGDTVAWDNHDNLPHTSTSNDNLWASPTLSNGGTYARVFGAAGPFAYHCAIHASMRGTIRVSDPNALPDLVVSALALPADGPDTIPGVQQRIDVSVRNDGLNRAAATEVAVSYVYQGERHLIGAAAVEELSPGEVRSATFTWSTLGFVGEFEVVAAADRAGQAAEANEANNEASATATVLVGGIPGIVATDPL